MPPRIVYDIDSTLADPLPVWFDVFRRDECVSPDGPHRAYIPGEVPTTFEHFGDWCPHCFDKVLNTPEIILRHALAPGALDLIKALDEAGWIQDIATSRDGAAIEPTRQWLDAVGVGQFMETVNFNHAKREVCERLGAAYLFDDSPYIAEQFLTGAPSSCALVLFDAPYNQHVAAPIRVRSFDEAWGVIGLHATPQGLSLP